MLVSLGANLTLGALCVGLFLALPFGLVADALVSGVLWVVGGAVLDRRLLARMSPEDRAHEMRRRADSTP